jgi:hypothetical protein
MVEIKVDGSENDIWVCGVLTCRNISSSLLQFLE